MTSSNSAAQRRALRQLTPGDGRAIATLSDCVLKLFSRVGKLERQLAALETAPRPQTLEPQAEAKRGINPYGGIEEVPAERPERRRRFVWSQPVAAHLLDKDFEGL